MESRKRIVILRCKGYSMIKIRQRLKEESIVTSQRTIHNVLSKFKNHRIYKDLPIQRRKPKITEEMKIAIEEALNSNDEITARGVQNLLKARWPDLQVSMSTIKRVRKDMQWVCTKPHYCQLLRPVS